MEKKYLEWALIELTYGSRYGSRYGKLAGSVCMSLRGKKGVEIHQFTRN
jgi:hypothetical protein